MRGDTNLSLNIYEKFLGLEKSFHELFELLKKRIP